MNNFLSSSFATSIPLASVVFSILYMIFGNEGLFIIATVCLVIPAITFLFVAIYIMLQFGRHTILEFDLDNFQLFQLALIQLSVIMFSINAYIAIKT